MVLAGLAAACLFERWMHRDEMDRPFAPTEGSADTIEFHPELIVRWDDEAHASDQVDLYPPSGVGSTRQGPHTIRGAAPALVHPLSDNPSRSRHELPKSE